MKKTAIGIAFLVSPILAYSAPVVIYDSGKTEPIDNYVSVFEGPKRFSPPSDPNAVARLQQELRRRVQAAGDGAFTVRLPIQSSQWKVGKVNSQDAYYPNLMKPIFIIGADETSIAWLKRWNTQLKAQKAVGWIVQAKNEKELRAIDAAGAGLTFITEGGDKLSRLFNLHSYPVLISSRSVEQ